MTDKEMLGKIWAEASDRLNAIGGRLIVPAMMPSASEAHQLTKEAHQRVLDLANWLDDTLNEHFYGEGAEE